MKTLKSLEQLSKFNPIYIFQNTKNDFWDTFLHYQRTPIIASWDGRGEYTIEVDNPNQSANGNYTRNLNRDLNHKLRMLVDDLKTCFRIDCIQLNDPIKEKRLKEDVLADLKEYIEECTNEAIPQNYQKDLQTEVLSFIKSLEKEKGKPDKPKKERKGSIQLLKIDQENNELFKEFYKALSGLGFIEKKSSAKLRRVFSGENLLNDKSDDRIHWLKKPTEIKYLFKQLSANRKFPRVEIKDTWRAVENNFIVKDDSGRTMNSSQLRVAGKIPDAQKPQLNDLLDILRS